MSTVKLVRVQSPDSDCDSDEVMSTTSSYRLKLAPSNAAGCSSSSDDEAPVFRLETGEVSSSDDEVIGDKYVRVSSRKNSAEYRYVGKAVRSGARPVETWKQPVAILSLRKDAPAKKKRKPARGSRGSRSTSTAAKKKQTKPKPKAKKPRSRSGSKK